MAELIKIFYLLAFPTLFLQRKDSGVSTFFENSKISKGKNYYDYSTADVNENPTVADLGENSFYIECMDCIGIDETEWNVLENCGECIFSEECNGRG